MDLKKVLAELREELADLDAAIASLEQLPQATPRGGSDAQRPAEAGGARRASSATAGPNRPSRDSA